MRGLDASDGASYLRPHMITITPAALQKIKAFQQADPAQAGKAFRVAVDSGGCSGFKYDFRFDERHPEDQLMTQEGVTVVVDPASLDILQGGILDFVEDFQGAGFVVQNPNATGGCGCGKSFSV